MKKKKKTNKQLTNPNSEPQDHSAFVSLELKYTLDPFDFNIRDNTDEVCREKEARSEKDTSTEINERKLPKREKFKPCADKIYQSLLNLIGFVEFVGEQPELEEKSISLIPKVIRYIKNLNSSEPDQDWMVSIWMNNYQAKGDGREGIISKYWDVSYEQNNLNIEAETTHKNDPINHWGNDFCCYSAVYFSNSNSELNQRTFSEDDLTQFIADVRKFRTYMAGSVDEILVEVDVYDSTVQTEVTGNTN